MTDTFPRPQKRGLTKKAKTGLIILCFTVLAALSASVIQLSVAQKNGDFGLPLPAVPDRLPFSLNQLKNSKDFFNWFDFNDYVAVVYIEGVIQESGNTYNQNWLLDTIEDLTYDRKNRGILLYIDSPGGGVYQSDEVYIALENYKHKTDNPVWAYMGPLAASGGYYIACAADVIYANRNTLTGSIGVISTTSVDLTELMNRYGIKMTTITAGKNKNMLSMNSPITEEQRAIMQSIADEAYEQFTDIVAQSRGIEIGKVRTLADGRIYTAFQAKTHGLVDYVDTYENALDNMLDTLFEGDVSINRFQFERKRTFSDYLYQGAAFFAKNRSFENELFDSAKKTLSFPEQLPLPAYYYQRP